MGDFVGTSGWYYSWNEGGNLDWFIENSRLNAVELNASLYRFPFKNQIAKWAKKGAALHWCVKVHRFVTHQHKFNKTARKVWEKFLDLFAPLDPFIDYYLFQVPPSMSDMGRMLDFFKNLPLSEKCALEVRNQDLLTDDAFCKRLQERVLLVSVDSPDVMNRIFSGNIIYLRMHGRKNWYRHDYSDEELSGTTDLTRGISPEKGLCLIQQRPRDAGERTADEGTVYLSAGQRERRT